MNKTNSKIKKEIKKFALTVKEGINKKENHLFFLQLTDKVRDDQFIELGVKLEDIISQKGPICVWKMIDPDVLIRERNERIEAGKSKKILKLQNRLSEKRKELSKYGDALTGCKERFISKYREKKFSTFDERGVPSRIMNGGVEEEVTKSLKKKFEKDFKLFTSDREKYTGEANKFEKIKEEITGIEEEINKLEGK